MSQFHIPAPMIRCVPPFWASSGHAQTILGHLLPSPALEAPGTRVEVPLPDGDRLITFHHGGGDRERASGWVVHLFHGLGGTIDADYMHRTALVCQRAGHAVVTVNHRGCGEGRGLARGIYHSGRGEDLSEAIALSRAMYPGKRHLAVGFSLSGNALLALVSGMRGSVLPDAAISVNAPIQLRSAAMRLKKGLNRIYDLRFVLQNRQEVHWKVGQGIHRTRYRIPILATLNEFDELYTSREAGFSGAEEYYARCSTKGQLERICVPTVLITAEDDPFVPVEDYREARLSPWVQLHVEPHGGHMGFLARHRTPLGSKRWLDYALDHYIRAITLSPTWV